MECNTLVRYTVGAVLLVAILIVGVGKVVSQPYRTLFVDDDDPTCGGNSPCYRTIQEAVTAAQPGDTVKIRPGRYYGPIWIDKSLTLSGESADLVTLNYSPDVPAPRSTLLQISGPVVVGPARVTIEHISIRWEAFAHAGIWITGKNPQVIIRQIRVLGHFFGIVMLGVKDVPLVGGWLAISDSELSDTGILIETDSPDVQRIEGNKLMNSGISLRGRGRAIINKNEIFGRGTGNGIFLGDFVSATLRENLIRNHNQGVWVSGNAQIQMHGNKILDNYSNGVVIEEAAQADLIGNHIIANGLESRVGSGLFYDPFFGFLGYKFRPSGFGIAVGDGASVNLMENHIEGNLFGLGATLTLETASQKIRIPQFKAQRNVITENGWGIWLRGVEATLFSNEITGNGIEALFNPALATMLDLFFPASGVLIQGGKPLLQVNRIAHNDLGVVVQAEASPGLWGNQILQNSGYGIALYQGNCFSYIDPGLAFQGTVVGEANQLMNNGKGDLCPPDYPWPSGFRK
ncbi:MAG: right-handed parallel beta-helix repeat-containing protein [Candidatus Caldarchaeum sp.]